MKKLKIIAIILIFVFIAPFSLISCSKPETEETSEEITTPVVETSTIKFNTGFEDVHVESITSEVGETLTPPEEPVKDGFKFIAWVYDGVRYVFDKMPEEDIELSAHWLNMSYSEGNLPCLSIDLFDENNEKYDLGLVNREDYIDSKITLSNTEEEYIIDSADAGFRGRGNGSWGGAGAKNGYKIKFKDKQSVFGREENKHWVILACANFNDATLYRNYLAYNMADTIFSNIEYTTNAEWIDVYINGEYQGVYLLCEHVRVGDDRVDIESEYGVEDTGYLIEYDAYASGEEGVDYFKIDGVKYPFTVKSPDPEEYVEEGLTKEEYKSQVQYIKNYIQDVYDAALSHDFETFESLVDINSFVDMYIIHELFKNVDTGWSSFFMYKKPNGKLYAGPVWDFDATTNINGRGDRSPQGIYVAQDVISGSSAQASELFIELYKTEGFLSRVKERWQQLSDDIEEFIDSKMNEFVYEINKSVMGRNFVLWKGKTQSEAEEVWIKDSRELHNWFRDRIDWLDYEWKMD